MISTRRKPHKEITITGGNVAITDVPDLSNLAGPVADILAGVTEVDEAELGPAILEKAIEEPTLDRLLDGNPKVIFDDARYVQLIAALRRERELFIKKEAKKKAKKEGIEDDADEGETA